VDKPSDNAASLPTVRCVRPRDVPTGTVIPPTVKNARCTGCGSAVLVSPSSAAMIARGVCRPVCPACVPAEALIGVMTAAQVRDLAKYAGAKYAG
jgi:ferredoxin